MGRGLAAFLDGAFVPGHMDDRGGVGGDGDVHLETCAVEFPVADDGTVDGLIGRLGPGDVSHDGRFDEDFPEPRRGFVRADSGDSLLEPTIQREEAGVDVVPVFIPVPLFPAGRRALGEHDPPAWIRLQAGDVEGRLKRVLLVVGTQIKRLGGWRILHRG